MLVLQPSPFCNLNCDYCYLPNRSDSVRMSLGALERIVAQVMESGLVGPTFSVVWHAGEPTAVPLHWYEAAFEVIAKHVDGRRITHHFQTNAVLIDEAWCDFFQRHNVQIGVSIDGPADLHDRHRRTRNGQGTHAQVMCGIAQLKAARIDFHSIAVLTRDALAQPDAIYEFFAALGAQEVGFNVEEVESDHRTSSLQTDDATLAARRFWDRMLERVAAERGRLRVREVASVLDGLRDPGFGRRFGNTQNRAGYILSVAHNGNFCFWSPELLGTHHAQHGTVSLGNLAEERINWSRFGERIALRRWQAEIDAGVRACSRKCKYFNLCLGGAPSNKLAEHGRLDGTETMACRLGQQAVIAAMGAALPGELLRLSK